MVWILIAAGICLTDLGVKRYIDSHKKENCHEPVAGGHIIITKYHNPGAMLGWMKDKPRMLLGITLFAIGVLTAGLMGALRDKRSPLIRFGLALLLGGAASNAYDRIVNHQVTDYFRISIGSKRLERIIFNLGDMAIFVGGFLAVLGDLKND
ncbi:MAG: signal peptidase II [Coprococcus sp.]